MKMLKKLNAALALALALTLTAPVTMPASPVAVAEAAVKINSKKKTLTVGQTYQLKITGTKKKITWKSSKKKVATVTSKGKVTAKSAGKAVISAKVKGGKTYKCNVTVKAASAAVANAPFTAKEVKLTPFTGVIPANYEVHNLGNDQFAILPEGSDFDTANSFIVFAIEKNPESANVSFDEFYDVAKQSLASSEEYYKDYFARIYEGVLDYYDVTSREMGNKKVLYEAAYATLPDTSGISNTKFVFAMDGYIIIIWYQEDATMISPSILKAVEYFVKTLE